MIQLEKQMKEVVENREQLLQKAHESETGKDKYYAEVKKVREINNRLDYAVQDAQKKLE